jgi:Zn-dependent M16 (insulinase) family peptidase
MNRFLKFPLLIINVICINLLSCYFAHHYKAIELNSLNEEVEIHGFKTNAIYLDEKDKPMGAGFVHLRSGFSLDYLKINSAPQAMIWVKTIPTSDMGEPHTQEHLILGKGNKGKYLSNLLDMSLAEGSARTGQWKTIYHFYTTSSEDTFEDTFYNIAETYLNALVYPDYTDEEIRREVRNFGVTEDPKTGLLTLEEKGTVYNEMNSAFEKPADILWHQVGLITYGKNHPLSYSSGGIPSEIRKLTPKDIRKFHFENYYLENMGMIVALPNNISMSLLLEKFNNILNKFKTTAAEENRKIITEKDFPKPPIFDEGKIEFVTYPYENEKAPGDIVFGWPAIQELTKSEMMLLELFIENMASDEASILYKKLIDTKSQIINIDAKVVWGWVNPDYGHPIYIGLDTVGSSFLTKSTIVSVRNIILEELKNIALYKDNSIELKKFNEQVQNRMIAYERRFKDFINSPPRFGFRGTRDFWFRHLYDLKKTIEFQKSLCLKKEFNSIKNHLNQNENIWKKYIKKWQVASITPIALATKADSKLLAINIKDKDERIFHKINELKEKYHTNDGNEAILHYKNEYVQSTKDLENRDKNVKMPKFIKSPPLTHDDYLDYKIETIHNNVQMVSSTFDNISKTTIGIAFSLNNIKENELMYLSILPSLMTEVGIIRDGKPIGSDTMKDMIRKEILNLNVYFSTNTYTDRFELVVLAQGSNNDESQKAVRWMKDILFNPYWRDDNINRMRDVIDQSLSGLRNTMLGTEEDWAENPHDAYRFQTNPLYLTTNSFLSKAYNVFRLKWQLKDLTNLEERNIFTKFMNKISEASLIFDRNDLKILIEALKNSDNFKGSNLKHKEYIDLFKELPNNVKSIFIEVTNDLEQLLSDIPDSSLAKDWTYLCKKINNDLMISPSYVLETLTRIRENIININNARMFIIGSKEGQDAVRNEIIDLLSRLNKSPIYKNTYTDKPIILTRLKNRLNNISFNEKPTFVGLINSNTENGIFIHSAPIMKRYSTNKEDLLNFLATKIYGGGGAHSFFMKTWSAGLAYSNGVSSDASNGYISYYAERCPLLPQTIKFVVDQIKPGTLDANLTEYALALVLSYNRVAYSYEDRGEMMADDLIDGETEESIRDFRKNILSLRNIPNLSEELFKRIESVYGLVLPGYGQKLNKVKEGVFFIIGPEKQFQMYEDYLKKVEDKAAFVYRLYPRDFWMNID